MNFQSTTKKLFLLFILFKYISWAQGFLPLDSAKIEGGPVYYNSMGDTWVMTSDSNGFLYIAWGDGTGLTEDYPSFSPYSDSCKIIGAYSMNHWQLKYCVLGWNDCYTQPYCPTYITDCGIGAALGSDPRNLIIGNINSNVPEGTPWVDSLGNEISRNDKPSSLVYINDTLFGSFHTKHDTDSLAGYTFSDTGYVAFSTDSGATWTSLYSTTPWVKGAPNKLDRFTVLMWINEGPAFADDKDNYLYGLGIGKEFFWLETYVYLTRVNKNQITNYNAYEYLVGYDISGNPIFKKKSAFAPGDSAFPVFGLNMIYKGSSIYHKPTDSYLAMTNDLSGELYLLQAPEPWGPWQYISTLIELDTLDYYGNPTATPNIPQGWANDGYVPGIFPIYTSKDSIFFTISNVGGAAYYQLMVGKVRLYPNTTVSIRPQAPDFSFKIIPNPNKGTLNINASVPMRKVELYGTKGERYLVKSTKDKKISIHLNLNPGLYFVKVTNINGQVQVKKLVLVE